MSHQVRIESIRYGIAKLSTEVVGVELLDIHNRGEVFAREPAAAFAHLVAADVARITARSFTSCSVVLE